MNAAIRLRPVCARALCARRATTRASSPNQIYGDRNTTGQAWYIRVYAPDGCYAYDGWWKDSEYKSPSEVIAEAIRGACLLEQNRDYPA